MTLKEARQTLNLNQMQVARELNLTTPQFSNYETGQVVAPLEDCIVLERYFNQKLDWTDTVNDRKKSEIMKALLKLSENYPLSSVLNFGVKYLREGQRIGVPEKFIVHYFKVSEELGQEPLIPPM